MGARCGMPTGFAGPPRRRALKSTGSNSDHSPVEHLSSTPGAPREGGRITAGGAGPVAGSIRDAGDPPSHRVVGEPGLRRLAPPAWLHRGIGLLIALLVLGAAVALWLAVRASGPHEVTGRAQRWGWGQFSFVYSETRPPLGVVLVAMGLGLTAILLTAGLTLRFLMISRTSLDPSTYPLSPHKIMLATQNRFDGPVTITVLVPAHNEAQRIGATLASLDAQTRRPDRVIVVADNCSDGTEAIARTAGAEIRVTVGNRNKKAGALNQALRDLLPTASHNAVIMVMDADTVLSRDFLEVADRLFTNDRALLAVGGIFQGEPGHGLLGIFQRNEYTRYARIVARRRGLVDVLTGTSTLFRPLALRTVAQSRGHALPGRPGEVYDTSALTEDNEITIALKTLGALMISPSDCTVVTELMPTWSDLWRQRLRWQRGAVENIAAYGLSRATFRYWSQQLGIGYGTVALTAYLACMAILVGASDTWVWFPFWLGVGLIFALERVVTAWSAGWAGRVVAAALIPELLFDLFLDAVFVYGLIQITLAQRAQWGHEHAEAKIPEKVHR
jgi:cellulose synthase/poly-beta-1,6-N-acetylglucosamine synthase-like glycosyltransferase